MNEKINLLIPCAGKSKRFFDEGFKKHKFFLPCKNNSTIIENIIGSFNQDIFKPHIIICKNQINLYDSELSCLKEKFPELLIHSIEEHNLGPTYSIMQIKVPENERIVVHYCDFLTEFKQDYFIDLILKGNIVAPYFSGFHPASLGKTNFAYMILDSLENLINLQEKKPFTDNRISEPASTGIYAFPSFKLFKKLSNKLFEEREKWPLPEAYTSLVLNKAIEEGHTVKCLKVKKFICLGTPRDYNEFIFWQDIYKKTLIMSEDNFSDHNHLVTAAGEGSRFQKENYRLPKILNKFRDLTLIEEALQSMKGAKSYILVLSKISIDFLKLKNNFHKLTIKKINHTPKGQLLSLKKLMNVFKSKEPFFVSSADYKFQINKTNFKNFINSHNPDIVIFTTKWEEFAHVGIENYGFISVNKNNFVDNIIEKPKYKIPKKLLNNLLIGTFWFKNNKVFEKLPINNVNGEAYIASSINTILKETRVLIFEVDYWLSMGTPRELNLAKYWFDYFNYYENKYQK